MAVLKTDGKTLETGTWSTASSGGPGSSLQPQKIVTFHVSENGDTLVQEAFETATGAMEQEEAAGVSQIDIETYETTDYSVVEQASEEIPDPGASHR